MENYHKTAGDTALFDHAPPMAEVVLEDIGKRQKRIIYAEAFKAGAMWWHADGRRGRNGLNGERISDYVCAATRTPKPDKREQLKREQLAWDLKHYQYAEMAPCPVCGISGLHACLGYKPEEMTPERESAFKEKLANLVDEVNKAETRGMYNATRSCINCGEPVASGMIHSCRVPLPALSQPMTPCHKCGVIGAHFCTGQKTHFPDLFWINGEGKPFSSRPPVADGEFTSVFEAQNSDYWVRINSNGRIKFSEGLMLRFQDMRVDVAMDPTGRLRVGESEHGRLYNARGYLYARRLAPLIDFDGQPSILVYLTDRNDGYLYGKLTLKDK